MGWFFVGLIAGLAIGIRDKFIDMDKLAQKIVDGKPIRIGDDLYRCEKITIK